MRVKVEEARSCMQAARSQSKVLDSLMQLKRSGQLPGIHGRLVGSRSSCSSIVHCVSKTSHFVISIFLQNIKQFSKLFH